MQKIRKEPEVVVFEEPKYLKRKSGKEDSKERKIFLVSARVDWPRAVHAYFT